MDKPVLYKGGWAPRPPAHGQVRHEALARLLPRLQEAERLKHAQQQQSMMLYFKINQLQRKLALTDDCHHGAACGAAAAPGVAPCPYLTRRAPRWACLNSHRVSHRASSYGFA